MMPLPDPPYEMRLEQAMKATNGETRAFIAADLRMTAVAATSDGAFKVAVASDRIRDGRIEWDYVVVASGVTIDSGDDLRSGVRYGATQITGPDALEALESLVSFLGAYAEGDSGGDWAAEHAIYADWSSEIEELSMYFIEEEDL